MANLLTEIWVSGMQITAYCPFGDDSRPFLISVRIVDYGVDNASVQWILTPYLVSRWSECVSDRRATYPGHPIVRILQSQRSRMALWP